MTGFMLILVLLGVFKWTVLGYLRRGHTHESIDQVHRKFCMLDFPIGLGMSYPTDFR